MPVTVGQDDVLGLALEEVERRLGGMDARDLTELMHLVTREVAHADRADFALFKQLAHRLGRCCDWGFGIGPVDLIDVDAVSAKAA